MRSCFSTCWRRSPPRRRSETSRICRDHCGLTACAAPAPSAHRRPARAPRLWMWSASFGRKWHRCEAKFEQKAGRRSLRRRSHLASHRSRILRARACQRVSHSLGARGLGIVTRARHQSRASHTAWELGIVTRAARLIRLGSVRGQRAGIVKKSRASHWLCCAPWRRPPPQKRSPPWRRPEEASFTEEASSLEEARGGLLHR